MNEAKQQITKTFDLIMIALMVALMVISAAYSKHSVGAGSHHFTNFGSYFKWDLDRAT